METSIRALAERIDAQVQEGLMLNDGKRQFHQEYGREQFDQTAANAIIAEGGIERQ